MPQASRFQFEVRKPDGAEAELAKREAARAFLRSDDLAAEQWIRSLLKVNPQSFAAHALRGQIADRAGHREEALRHYQQALRLLDAGADQQFFQANHPSVVTNALEGLKNTVREHSRPRN